MKRNTRYNREDSATALPQLEKEISNLETAISDISEKIKSFEKIVSTNTASDILSPAAGVTIDNFHYESYGKIAMMYFRASPNAAKSGTWTVATINEGYRPVIEAGSFSGGALAPEYIHATGAIYYVGNVSANGYIYVKTMYILK